MNARAEADVIAPHALSTTLPASMFQLGVQTIERAIIEGAWAVGRHITRADFTWRHGRLMPNMTRVEVRIGRRATVGVFTWEEIGDAVSGVDRPETLRAIQRIVSETSQMRR